MDSSDDEDLRLALAISSAEAAVPSTSSSAAAASRTAREGGPSSRRPPPREAPIELGDSSDDDIQILDDGPPPRGSPPQGPASASAARYSSASRNAAVASSPPRRRQPVASGTNGPRGSSSSTTSVAANRARSGLIEANAVRRRDVELVSSSNSRSGSIDNGDDDVGVSNRALTVGSSSRRTGFDGLGEFRRAPPPAGSGGGRTLGRAPAPRPMMGHAPPQPLAVPRESFEEGGMDAELMLAMHKSREDDERRRLLKEKQQALMAETDEEEALRLAIEASLNAPLPPAPSKSPRKRAHSSSPSVADSDDDDDGPDKAFQKQMDEALRASKAERRKLVIPRTAGAAAGFGGGGRSAAGPLFGQPGLFDEGGRLSGGSTPSAKEEQRTLDAGSSRSTTLAVPSATRPPDQSPASGAISTTPTPSSATATSTPLAERTTPDPAAVLPTGPTRAQMEAERLQRVRARQAATGQPAAADATDGPSAAKRVRLSSPSAQSAAAIAKGKGREQPPPRPVPAGLTAAQPALTDRFWNGTLGMTDNEYTRGLGAGPEDGAGRSFRIGDLISEPQNIVLSVVSTYCIEPAFLAQYLPHPLRAPCILVSQPPEGAAGTADRGRVLPGVWDCFPWVHKYASAHMKFMLLWYKDGRMRVVISTANLMQHDWEAIENMVWVQDFLPRRASGSQRSDFGDQWVDILKALGVHKAYQRVRTSLADDPRRLALLPFDAISDMADRWDYSAVIIRLVASLAGKREGWAEIEASGIGRLGKVLRQEGWVAPRGKTLNSVEAQGSSLGDYSKPWTNVFWRSVQGEEPRRFLRAALDSKDWPAGIKIIYPSLRTVDATHRGRPGAGTFFCSSAKFAKCPQLFHDALSKRGGRTVMHLKILAGIFNPLPQTLGAAPVPSSSGKRLGHAAPKQQKLFDVDSDDSSETDLDEANVYLVKASKGKTRPSTPPDDGNAPPQPMAGGFLYIGSHNFTPSAWGTVTMAKAASRPTLNIRNFELGFVMPLCEHNAEAHASSIAPYQRPVHPYRKDDVPWIQGEHMPPGV